MSNSWKLPNLSLLENFQSDDVPTARLATEQQARLIEETLANFKLPVKVEQINTGPTITQFGLKPGSKVTASSIAARADDLALALAVPSVRVELPIPGKSLVGIEVPNLTRRTVGLGEILSSAEFAGYQGILKLALGRAIAGQPVIADLAAMPHLLIAGATNAGKSVCINSLIASLLFQCPPDQLQFIMVDPKQIELIGYDGIPHLRFPVVTQVQLAPDQDTEATLTAGRVLAWAIAEMERRYKILAHYGYRNLASYNASFSDEAGAESRSRLPYLAIIIDELADLMMSAPQEIETAVVRLAQKARAAGIHLILATQRPSVDVVTGLIKANLPSRIAFAVASQIDSRTILDTVGAEKLLGRGDMLYLGGEVRRPLRVQGTFVSDEEIIRLVDFWRAQNPASGATWYQTIIEQRDLEGEPDLPKAAAGAKVATKANLLQDKSGPAKSASKDQSARIKELEGKLAASEAEVARLRSQLEIVSRLKLSVDGLPVVDPKTLQVDRAIVNQLITKQSGQPKPAAPALNKSAAPASAPAPTAPVTQALVNRASRKTLTPIEEARLTKALAQIHAFKPLEKQILQALLENSGKQMTYGDLVVWTGYARQSFKRAEMPRLLKSPFVTVTNNGKRDFLRAVVDYYASQVFPGVEPGVIISRVKKAL